MSMPLGCPPGEHWTTLPHFTLHSLPPITVPLKKTTRKKPIACSKIFNVKMGLVQFLRSIVNDILFGPSFYKETFLHQMLAMYHHTYLYKFLAGPKNLVSLWKTKIFLLCKCYTKSSCSFCCNCPWHFWRVCKNLHSSYPS